MQFGNWVSLLVGGALTALPTIVHILPPPWNIAATAAIGFATSMYHLFKPAPVSR